MNSCFNMEFKKLIFQQSVIGRYQYPPTEVVREELIKNFYVPVFRYPYEDAGFRADALRAVWEFSQPSTRRPSGRESMALSANKGFPGQKKECQMNRVAVVVRTTDDGSELMVMAEYPSEVVVMFHDEDDPSHDETYGGPNGKLIVELCPVRADACIECGREFNVHCPHCNLCTECESAIIEDLHGAVEDW